MDRFAQHGALAALLCTLSASLSSWAGFILNGEKQQQFQASSLCNTTARGWDRTVPMAPSWRTRKLFFQKPLANFSLFLLALIGWHATHFWTNPCRQDNRCLWLPPRFLNVTNKVMRLPWARPGLPLEQFLRSFLFKCMDFVEKMEIKRRKWMLGKH